MTISETWTNGQIAISETQTNENEADELVIKN